MSVLCAWPDTKNIEDCSDVFPFQRFNAIVSQLDKHLVIGGHLAILNANFLFKDTDVYPKYAHVGKPRGSGFVRKFDSNNKALPDDFTCRETVFKKMSA